MVKDETKLGHPSVHYRFRGLELKTENAAKSPVQASKWFLRLLPSLVDRTSVALDYGCGKLRYAIPLSRCVKHLCAVDSREQLERTQQISSKRTTLKRYARSHLKNVSVVEISSGSWRRKRFDLVLCSNVLSVIPRRAERLRVLRTLRRVLRPRGNILVSTQFRNSHFASWQDSPNATWTGDGWLVRGIRGASFYAIIPPAKLSQLCRDAGLHVNQFGSNGETAFAFASLRPNGARLPRKNSL